MRLGVPPIRIEVLTTISGVQFAACYAERIVATIDGVDVNVISLYHLAAARTVDAIITAPYWEIGWRIVERRGQVMEKPYSNGWLRIKRHG